MRRLQLALGLLPLSCAAVLAGACNNQVAGVGLVLKAPQGLLDDVTAMTLEVTDSAGLSCDPATGTVSGAGAEPQRFPLENSGCAAGATWCKTITLDQDDSEKIFRVVGSAAGQELAQGCAVATIDQDPLEVKIQAFAVNPPGCCNDGVLQATEQCDPMGAPKTDCEGNAASECGGVTPDSVCACDCLANEILLTIPNDLTAGTAPPTINNEPGSKADLSLAFAGATANVADVANSLRAVFTDLDPNTTNTGPDITQRMLNGSMYPIADTNFRRLLRLPTCAAIRAEGQLPRQQIQPSAGRVSDSVVGVAFASDEDSPNVFDIKVSAQGINGCAEQFRENVHLNETTGVSCEWPALAGGPAGTALVVWNQGGAIRGRIWDETDFGGSSADLTPTAADIEIASVGAGTKARVAGSANGWVVVYEGAGAGDGDGVFYKTVDTGGTVGSEVLVNAVTGGNQNEPAVGMLPDGSFAVVWNSSGDIFMQRYDASGAANPTDQDTPISTNSPAGLQPVIASGGGIDTFYIIAWLTTEGTIWGRLADGAEGFRRNNVTGQVDDFLATHPGVETTRTGPAVAVGGLGFIAIGWVDTGASFGVKARRFPLPPR